MSRDAEIAWAAGVFEGEGTVAAALLARYHATQLRSARHPQPDRAPRDPPD